MMYLAIGLVSLLCVPSPLKATYTEDNILELIRLYLPDNPVILEAGAHHGEDTAKMKKMWPGSVIYSFEPHPDNYRALTRTVRGLSGVHCFQIALGNANGSAGFYCCRMNDGGSSLLPSAPFKQAIYNDQEPIMVPCLTLDTWAQDNRVDPIDFCWLDMEGTELQMLQHAPCMLATIKAIYIEVNFQEYRVGMVQYKDMYKFLTDNGFVQVWITPGTNYEVQANALFVRKDLIHLANASIMH
jgi:FkbM family methyltransferase